MDRTLSALLAAALLLPAAFARDKSSKPKMGPDETADSNTGKGVNLYSMEREIALGRQMALEVELEARPVYDSIVTEYINRLGQNLVRNSGAKVPFTIKVLDSEEVNAFALPGGYLFVNTGMVLKAENEAELAGVLAHEIAHVAARHGTRQATRGQLINYASIPLIFMGGWAGYAIRQAATLAVPLGFLKFSRAMESEADRLGLAYLYRTGYDPTAFVDFFERMETVGKKQPGAIARAFSSHPMTNDRIHRAQKEIQEEFKGQPQYVLDTSEFHSVREGLAKLEDRRNASRQYDYVPPLKRR